MFQLMLTVHVLICISLIVLVLIQHGKGADMGASLGGGASQTLFGSQGSASFLMKFTGGLAILFFITSLALSYIVSHQARGPQLILPQNIPASLGTDQTGGTGGLKE